MWIFVESVRWWGFVWMGEGVCVVVPLYKVLFNDRLLRVSIVLLILLIGS